MLSQEEQLINNLKNNSKIGIRIYDELLLSEEGKERFNKIAKAHYSLYHSFKMASFSHDDAIKLVIANRELCIATVSGG